MVPFKQLAAAIVTVTVSAVAAGCGGSSAAPAPVDTGAEARQAAARATGAKKPVLALMRGLLTQDAAAVCGAFQLERIAAENSQARLAEVCDVDATELFDPDDGLPLEGLDATLPIGFSAAGKKLTRVDADTGESRLGAKVPGAVADALLATVPLQTAAGTADGLYRVFAGPDPSQGVSVGYFDGVAQIASLTSVPAEGLKLAKTPTVKIRECLPSSGGRKLFDRGLLEQPESGKQPPPLFAERDGAQDPVIFEYDEGVKADKDVLLALVPFLSDGAAKRAYATLKLTEPEQRAAILRLGSVLFVSANEQEQSAKIPAPVQHIFRTCAGRAQLLAQGPRNIKGPAAEDF